MKTLGELLRGIETSAELHELQIPVESVVFDSREVVPGSLFVAVKGSRTDGHQFIAGALQNGAVAVVCEAFPDMPAAKKACIIVPDSREALGIIAANFYDNPSDRIELVGITGTNGKTTVATLLHSLFESQGIKAGLISTVLNKVGDEDTAPTHTTPDPVQLQRLLSRMAEKGCKICFMEVSSHAIDQKRIAGIQYKGGIFTNLSHDHLDYHLSFDEYLRAKKRFFDALPASAFALINVDDRNGKVMVQNSEALVKTYSLKGRGDFNCRVIENQLSGLHLNIGGADIWFRLIGRFNAYNLLAAYSAAHLLGMDNQRILAGLSVLHAAEGRFDYIRGAGNIIGIVDYAHTPDALENVLDTIAGFRTGNETIITVFGAGGDRDRAKRPLMGKIAATKSDKVIITSDNPRNEKPEIIIDEIIKGVPSGCENKVIVIANREQAVKAACMMAHPDDIILVAGKGHEKYQDINGTKYPFDDKEILRRYLLIKTHTG